MNKYIFFFILFGFYSCKKVEIKPQEPLQPQPIITDTTSVDSTTSLIGQTWVITKVLNTNFNEEFRNDTLVFITKNTYKFNQTQSTYSFYFTTYDYTLTLNNTPWGFISGKISPYNIINGDIPNCQFRDYFTGDLSVKIWMKKQ